MIPLLQGALPQLGAALEVKLDVLGGVQLVERSWKEYLWRLIIPLYAARQDQLIAQIFTRYLRNYLIEERRKAGLDAVLNLAERHIASLHTKEAARVQRYILAVRLKYDIFAPAQSASTLIAQEKESALYRKWQRLGYADDAYLRCPDLVDFIFTSDLHHRISHKDYRHTIDFVDGDARVRQEGEMRPWARIRQQIHWDEDQERFFSIEAEERTFWDYRQRGFVRWQGQIVPDAPLLPLRILETGEIPSSCQVQIVTSHAPPSRRFFLFDHLMRGSRHTFFRLLTREGFEGQGSGLQGGAIYSFGRYFPDSVPRLQPLTTVSAYWTDSDYAEFGADNLCVTTLDITDAQAHALIARMREDNTRSGGLAFNILSPVNCAGRTAQVLREAGIIDLPAIEFLFDLWYRLLVPQKVREGIDYLASSFVENTPRPLGELATCIAHISRQLLLLAHSVALSPLYLALGAWRRKISEALDNPQVTRVQAIFSDIFDLLRPMSLGFTLSIYEWQRQQSTTTYEFQDWDVLRALARGEGRERYYIGELFADAVLPTVSAPSASASAAAST